LAKNPILKPLEFAVFGYFERYFMNYFPFLIINFKKLTPLCFPCCNTPEEDCGGSRQGN
jgi:hypothetical protein